MADEGFKRKLAAILNADVEGYSRLMDDDEEETVRTLTSYRTAISDFVKQFRGRIVDTPGDNILADFASVVDAVNCAVEIQQELAERNAEQPDNRKMHFRIGVNLGDVIEEDDRIYGDGVNIAARIEGLANAGGICISGSAHEQIENKLPLKYEFMGVHSVKNIPKPIRVYRAQIETEVSVKKKKKIEISSPRSIAFVFSAVLLIGIAAIVASRYILRPTPSVEPASVEKMAFPLPQKPSVAVLPFVNMSADPNQEYLVDGISENIITALSTIPDIFVIDRNSAFSYKEKPVKVKQVAEDLGIQYVVEGSLQKAGERIQLTTRLLNALTGRNLWAKSFKTDLNDIFEVQNEITINILKAIHAKSIYGFDAEFYLDTKSIEAMNYFKKGRDNFLRDDYGKAIELYKKALEVDPGYAAAWAALAEVYHYIIPDRHLFMEPTEARVLRTDCLTKALEIDSTIPMAQALFAKIYQENGQYEIAIKQLENAIDKNPNSALLYYKLGELLSQGGSSKEAIALIEKAIRLNPFYPGQYFEVLTQSYFLLQQYDIGLQIAEQLLDRGQKEGNQRMLKWGHMWSAINLVELGQDREAQAHMKEYLKPRPYRHVNFWEGYWKDEFQNPADLERILNAMHKAGLRRF